MKTKNLLHAAMLWLIVIALAACGPQLPAQPQAKVIQPSEVATLPITPVPPPSTGVLHQLTPRDANNGQDVPPINSTDPACQGLLGVDLGIIGEYYDPSKYPIVWTFSLNFKKFGLDSSGALDYSRPIGCVRFFFYNFQLSAYDPMPSEVDVECSAQGNVSFSSIPATAITSVATPFQDVGVAEFRGGQIVCPLNLTRIVTKAPTRYRISPELSYTYVYSYFAMATIGSDFPNQKAYYPILYHEPLNVPNQDLLYSQPISHSIGPYDNQAFYATFGEATIGPVLNHNSEQLQDWWIYNWPQNNHSQNVTFARLQADQAPPYSQEIIPNAADPVHFWTGPATLVIGGGPGAHLNAGRLYEVLIDPTGGSKPPGGD